MNIAVDGYEANQEIRVGIGRYAFELLHALHRLQTSQGTTGRSVQYRVFVPDQIRGDMPAERPNWQYRQAGPKPFWTFFGLPWALIRSSPRPDLVFSPTHYIPRFIRIPRVMAIMDLSYLSHSEKFTGKDRYQLVHWTAYSVQHASHIITISQFSKHAIMDAYHVPADRVTVVYPGLTEGASTVTFEHIRKKYDLSKHYILAVGTLQPRKNYDRLIAAFASFLREYKQPIGSVQLVIVGKKGWLYQDILSAPERYGVEQSVKFLDFVPDVELPAMYTHALCLAMPSLYEGFGLPVLEAMSRGCPVVVSNTSSLPEIAGEAGIYVSPERVGSIKDGLLTAIRERNLMQGRKRIAIGRERSAQFTWDRAARDALQVFDTVMRPSAK